MVVGDPNEIVKTDAERARVIRHLLAKGFSEEIWNELIRTDPNLATRLSYARIHAERAKVLETFHDNLEEDQPEDWWQDFFEENTWIFGYGLNYQVLKTVQAQPRYGGQSLSGKGTQKGDYLQRTEATAKFTVIVEIKRPGTQLLGSKRYRNGAWELGGQLTGGISQVLANCSKWENEGSKTEENREVLSRQNIFTVQPKGILVIGHTDQLSDLEKRNTFQLLRRNTLNPEMLTFDELYERAKFIVERTGHITSDNKASDPNDDEIPF